MRLSLSRWVQIAFHVPNNSEIRPTEHQPKKKTAAKIQNECARAVTSTRPPVRPVPTTQDSDCLSAVLDTEGTMADEGPPKKKSKKEKRKSTDTAASSADKDVETKDAADTPTYEERCKAINILASPLASKKSTKKAHKLVRKASQSKSLRRGVKEVRIMRRK